MRIVLDKNSSQKDKQALLLEQHKKRMERQYDLKKRIVEETFGVIQFDRDRDTDVSEQRQAGWCKRNQLICLI